MIRMTRIDVPGGEVACWTGGSGAPVVLLHGGALDHSMWAPQIESLHVDHLVIAPDARGHGRSSTPTAPSRACDDVAAVIDAVAGGPAVVVGLSMGARTAVDTALEHSHLVRGLVVSGAGAGEPAFRDPFLLDMFAEWRAAEQARDAGRWVEAFLRAAHGKSRKPSDLPADLVAALRAAAHRTVAHHASAEAVAQGFVDNAAERVGEIAVPVLAVCGALDSEDHIRAASGFAEQAGGRCALIEGTAHYPNLERPAQFDALLRDFLAAGRGWRRAT